MDRSPPNSSPIVPALRAATGEAHLALEQAVDIERCVGSRPRYTKLLQDFLGFYRPLEQRLESAGDWTSFGLDFAPRRKAPWLRADLAALGLAAREIDSLPDAPELPATGGIASAFGCLYVLEGATLGGRLISGMLRASPIPPEARTFFGSYGADTGRRWQEFVAALEGAAARGTDSAQSGIITAANQTFACLHRWMRERSSTS